MAEPLVLAVDAGVITAEDARSASSFSGLYNNITHFRSGQDVLIGSAGGVVGILVNAVYQIAAGEGQAREEKQIYKAFHNYFGCE